MNIKVVLLLVGIAAVGIFFYGRSQYDRGREDLRRELLTAPSDRDTSTATVVSTPPPDTMFGGPASPPVIRIPSRTMFSTPRNRATIVYTGPDTTVPIPDIPPEVSYLYADTLRDSHGGSHAVTFEFPAERFGEVFTPGPDTARTVTVVGTRYVPSDPPPFWFSGIAAYPGLGAAVGYESFGVGCLWVYDRPAVPFISYTWRF